MSSCGEIALGVRADNSLVLIDPRCLERRLVLSDAVCPGDTAFQSISALAAGRERLYVADEQSARVLLFSLPGLELSASWQGPFRAPRRLALDSAGQVYVLDVALQGLLRLDSMGRAEQSYDTGEIADLANGLDLWVSSDGAAFVSIDGAQNILRFAPSGALLEPLLPPQAAPALMPGALAGDTRHLYVADRASGAVWVYDLAAGRWLAPLPHFRAPVAGLASDGEGHLYIRTGAEATYLRLNAGNAYVSRGVLEAGPFDAGERCAWMRVHVDAEVPVGTRVRVEVALADRSDPSAALTWRTAPGLDCLVHVPRAADVPADPSARFLWINVHLETDDPAQSPRLRQIVAETPGEDYLSKLPAVYAREDAEAGGFLRALLETFRAELGDSEREITSLARRLDPATAPADHLEWLASWVGYELPAGASTASQRTLLQSAHRLYERRGTVQGLREMVRIHTKVDCEIVESFRSRHLWALGGQACLGVDTGLLPALPDGMVVPGPSLPEPSLQGLGAEYFLDDHLGRSAAMPDRGDGRCQPRVVAPALIEPDGGFPGFEVPAPEGSALAAFSVLWTGQIRAHYSELFSFYFAHDGGARLYVDNQLLIDSWTTPGEREPRGSLPLSAARWYLVRIEYWSDNLDATAPRLSWSSHSQRKQLVPQECLYAVTDDNINPEARRNGGSEAMVVGETVVGAHGPLATEDFGAPLFADTAHLFTVRVHAASVRAPGQLDAIRALLDAEKPAHTDYHLCVIEPQFRVGVQACIGVDAIVAPAPPPGRYGEGELGIDTRLGISPEHDDGSLRVEENFRVGRGAVLR